MDDGPLTLPARQPIVFGWGDYQITLDTSAILGPGGGPLVSVTNSAQAAQAAQTAAASAGGGLLLLAAMALGVALLGRKRRRK